MPKFDVEPILPGQGPQIDADLTRGAIEQAWVMGLSFAATPAQIGWNSCVDALKNGSLLIGNGQNEELEAITDADAFKSSRNAEKTDPVAMRAMEASIDGRLFIRHKDTGKLLQLQLTKLDFMEGGFDLSRPLDRLPWMPEPEKVQGKPEPEKVQGKPEPEKVQGKPEKPGLWTRLVAFLFKNSAAAETVRQYEAALAAYNEQQAQLNPQPEGEAARPKAAEPARGKVPESLDGIFTETTFESLRASVEAKKPLDPEAAQDNAAAQKANDCYQKGLQSRYALLAVLRDGTFDARNPEQVRSLLGNAMLGEMVRRSVQDGGKDAFYQQLENDPNFLATWKENLLNTPAAKEVLAGGAEAMGRVVGYFTHFGTLMNNAIPQANDIALQPNIPEPEPVPAAVNDGPSMTNTDPKPMVPGGM